MLTVERRVGRLMEAAGRSPITPAELTGADRAMESGIRALGSAAIVIADFRHTKFLLEDDAAHLGEIFRHHNLHIERSAILVSAHSAVGVLQMERVIREANYPSRRAFRDADQAAVWLGEVLDAQERSRLRAFLAENSVSLPNPQR